MFKSVLKNAKQSIGSLILPHLPWQLYDFGFSGRVVIEPTNVCNLRCPMCPTSKLKRARGFLSLNNFKEIVDGISGLKLINMSFAGEPLLNKDTLKMVEYAEKKGIRVIVSTNSVFLGERIDEVLNSGLDTIIVCLDGVTKETHEAYRRGSDFEEVKNNIRMLCAEKKKRGLKKPKITLQFLVMKHNEHEIPAIKLLAKELGVDELSLKSMSLGTHHNTDERVKLGKDFLPSERFSRYKWNRGKPIIKEKPKLCHWVRRSVILWNGDVICCCYDFEGKLVVGNVFRDGGFDKVWRSEKYKKYRKKIIRREFEICKRCNLQ
jgi:radical SAM protein with 4Fe4S-binding SPASM domain